MVVLLLFVVERITLALKETNGVEVLLCLLMGDIRFVDPFINQYPLFPSSSFSTHQQQQQQQKKKKKKSNYGSCGRKLTIYDNQPTTTNNLLPGCKCNAMVLDCIWHGLRSTANLAKRHTKRTHTISVVEMT
jgi:hypothetical protein